MSVNADLQPRWNDRKFHFDPTKPRWIQILKIAAQMGAFFGGLVLSLVSMLLYPMLLTDRGFGLVYLGGPLLAFGVTFLLVHRGWFPADMPQSARLQVRLGLGMCAAFACAGLFGIVNGYRTPLVIQDSPMVYRRTSTPSDPKHMGYYVGTRVWPSSRDVYEVTVPRSVYTSLVDVPVVTQRRVTRQQIEAMPGHGSLRLKVGRGRLGVNWLNGVIGADPHERQTRHRGAEQADPTPKA